MQLSDLRDLGSECWYALVRPPGTTYYTLTGFHGAHVFGGVLMLSVVLYRGLVGQFRQEALRRRSSQRHAVMALRRTSSGSCCSSLLYLLPRALGGDMHPLRHPVTRPWSGLLFVVIGIVYWAVPYLGGLARRLRRADDARSFWARRWP
jgi:hypothetical protein